MSIWNRIVAVGDEDGGSVIRKAGFRDMKLTSEERERFIACVRELLENEHVRSMDRFIQHGRVSCLEHCVSVAYYSYWLCRRLRMRIDDRSLIRGALLHDFFLYDWHTAGTQYGLHGFTHPRTALGNAQQHFSLNETEKDIILDHMWPLTISRFPKRRETHIVCLIDKWRSLAETFRLARPALSLDVPFSA